MQNFIFISPNFPANYWRFCRELKNDGFRVLGIGDCPYDALTQELKNSVDEYYWVTNLENYDEVYRAVAFFAFKYGKIDFLESNNEYWLERDALLRTEFNIATGFTQKDVKKIKLKSFMKRSYKKAGVKTARYCFAKSAARCYKFVEEVGFPVIAKPDNGVGANDTYKLKNLEELKNFLSGKPQNYILEEFIDGETVSYDAIIDGLGNPVFETGNVFPQSVMDVVNDGKTFIYYTLKQPHPEVADAGRRTVKAFGVKNRFVHFEFFRLLKNQYIGKKGEVVALEVNMRPAGGFTPDMINFANSTDVYKIWADTLAFGGSQCVCGEKFFCAYAGRRKGKEYVYSEQDVRDRFGANLKAVERMPDVLSGAMGNMMYIANFKTEEDVEEFFKYMVETR